MPGRNPTKVLGPFAQAFCEAMKKRGLKIGDAAAKMNVNPRSLSDALCDDLPAPTLRARIEAEVLNYELPLFCGMERLQLRKRAKDLFGLDPDCVPFRLLRTKCRELGLHFDENTRQSELVDQLLRRAAGGAKTKANKI